MNRDDLFRRVTRHAGPWDMLVIGGGATGVGIAVDAASRGYDVALFERHDFGKGTSSRSTKLIHGGVRYLEQGNIALVLEALRERGILRRNAPHLVSDLAFIVPSYDWWQTPFYGLGLKVYNALAGRYGFGASAILSRAETLQRLPTIRTEGLRGGVRYHDGQFDDARLLMTLAATAVDHGAVLLNYVRVEQLTRSADGFVDGVIARDMESGALVHAHAKAVINATGPFADDTRSLDNPAREPLLVPSQGVHLVFDRTFLPGSDAIMVPHTRDGRVLFAIPWLDRTLVGTTDTPIAAPSEEPAAFEEEISFILDTAAQYLHKAPSRQDVLSVFVGIRPLVRSGQSVQTSAVSREHVVHIDASGLMTVAGGKWTTYRQMAQDTVNRAAEFAHLDERPCVTRSLPLHGTGADADSRGRLRPYGTDARGIEQLMRDEPTLSAPLHASLPYTGAEVVWAVRHEMARTVEDVLARRCRALFLDARVAAEIAPRVADLLARELGRPAAWVTSQVDEFRDLAARYLVR